MPNRQIGKSMNEQHEEFKQTQQRRRKGELAKTGYYNLVSVWCLTLKTSLNNLGNTPFFLTLTKTNMSSLHLKSSRRYNEERRCLKCRIFKCLNLLTASWCGFPLTIKFFPGNYWRSRICTQLVPISDGSVSANSINSIVMTERYDNRIGTANFYVLGELVARWYQTALTIP